MAAGYKVTPIISPEGSGVRAKISDGREGERTWGEEVDGYMYGWKKGVGFWCGSFGGWIVE